MSKAPPARIASFETVATTSPVESRPRIAGPGAGGVVRDDLRDPEGGLQPVEDGEAVPHHARGRLRRAEPEQDQRPAARARGCRSSTMPVLDRPADRERASAPARPSRPRRRRRLRARVVPLVPPDPEEQTQRRPGVRVAGVGEGKLDHGCRCTENYAPEARRLIVPAASAGVYAASVAGAPRRCSSACSSRRGAAWIRPRI